MYDPNAALEEGSGNTLEHKGILKLMAENKLE